MIGIRWKTSVAAIIKLVTIHQFCILNTSHHYNCDLLNNSSYRALPSSKHYYDIRQ